MSWLTSRTTKPILYCSGPAGSGKTHTLHEVIRIAQEQHIPSASFFFHHQHTSYIPQPPDSRDSRPKRRPHDGSTFVGTLVYQLIGLFPSITPNVLEVIKRDPHIFDKPLSIQTQKLLLDVLPRIHHRPPILLLVFDGLNEEPSNPHQLEEILHSIGQLVSNPFLNWIRCVVSARPISAISRFFNSPCLRDKTFQLEFENHDHELRQYFLSEFKRVWDIHPVMVRLRQAYHNTQWPCDADISTLVHCASSQFLFAQTVVDYVTDTNHHPIRRLQKLLDYLATYTNSTKLPPVPGTFTSILNPLYTLILHPPQSPGGRNVRRLRSILHAIVEMVPPVPTSPSFDHSLFLDKFLGLRDGTTAMALAGLRSVVHVPDAPMPGRQGTPSRPELIQIHHASFRQYLLSPSRSGDFYQSRETTARYLAERCSYHLTRWSRHPTRSGGLVVSYARDHWQTYMERSVASIPEFTSARTKLGLQDRPTDLKGRAGLTRGSAHVPTARGLSNKILGFDPATIIRHTLLHGPSSDFDVFSPHLSIASMTGIGNSVHSQLCSKAMECSPLCKSITSITSNRDAILKLLGIAFLQDVSEFWRECVSSVVHELDGLLQEHAKVCSNPTTSEPQAAQGGDHEVETDPEDAAGSGTDAGARIGARISTVCRRMTGRLRNRNSSIPN